MFLESNIYIYFANQFTGNESPKMNVCYRITWNYTKYLAQITIINIRSTLKDYTKTPQYSGFMKKARGRIQEQSVTGYQCHPCYTKNGQNNDNYK